MNFYKPLFVFCLLLPGILPAQTTSSIDSVNKDGFRFEKIEVEATFPGGEKAWRDFLIKNMDAASPFDNGAPYGRFTVLVQFVVNKEGGISDIKALTNLGYGMEEEVVRIIKKSGNWIPAMQNGRVVNAIRRQPVTFFMDEAGFEINSAEPYTLYTGIDNEISVKVRKVSPENLSLMITKGSVGTIGNGRFMVKVNTPGRVTITVYNRKNEKEIGAYSFEVKSKN